MKVRVRVRHEMSLWDRLRVLTGSPVNHTLVIDCETGKVTEDIAWIGKPDPKSVLRLPIGSGKR